MLIAIKLFSFPPQRIETTWFDVNDIYADSDYVA